MTVRNLRLAAPLLLVIFGGCYCQPSPNGKEGKLQFAWASQFQAFGAESRIDIPEHVLLEKGGGKYDLYVPYDDQLDFRDTTLETTVTGGLEVIEVIQKENRDYQVRLLCKAETGTAGELRVKIKRGDRVQYEDALDISCFRNPRTTSDHDGEAWILDRGLDVKIAQIDEKGELPLTTHCLRFPDNGPFALNYGDAGVPERLYTGQPIRLRTVAPTASLEFSSGEYTGVLPIRILSDDQWRLQLSVTAAEPQGSGTSFRLLGTAVAPAFGDGGVQGLTSCEFRAVEVNGNGTRTDSPPTCRSTLLVTDLQQRACLRFRDNVGCLLLSPDGGVEATDAGF